MKKSKVIIPALAMLVLSTAASVTGTVAWFTANRTKTITVGEFNVVNTTDNLSVELGGGIGTSKSSETAIGVTANLTDGSFNHLYIADNPVLPIINPNVQRTKVASAVALANANTTNLSRGSNTYTVLTWTMQFKIDFSDSAENDIGLYLDLSDKQTYMHEAVTFPDDDGAGANTTHTILAGEDGDYYDNADLTGDPTTVNQGQTIEAGKWYKAAPDSSGKAFRIAFVPTAMSDNKGSVYGEAYTKVWADNETSATADGLSERQFVNQHATDASLSGTNYDNNTSKYYYDSSLKYGSATSAGGVLMASGNNSPIPNDGARTIATALSTDANYLGYFKCTPGAQKSITYTCVAWYEGSNPNVQTSKTLEQIAVSMKFGVVDLSSGA